MKKETLKVCILFLLIVFPIVQLVRWRGKMFTKPETLFSIFIGLAALSVLRFKK